VEPAGGSKKSRSRGGGRGLKFKRSWFSMMLVSLCVCSAIAIVLVGGWGIMPRFLVSLAVACGIMSVLFLAKLDWLAGIVGIPAFIIMAILPQNILPMTPMRPMGLLDMVQSPLSTNTLLVLFLLLLGFCVAVAALIRSKV